MVVLSSPHNDLLTKLHVLNINALTDAALSRFIEEIQNRRAIARIAAQRKKVQACKPKKAKRAKKKATHKRTNELRKKAINAKTKATSNGKTVRKAT